jgi:4-aminobutyrate aminotransferase
MEHLFRGIGRLSTLTLEHGVGSFVYTATGQRLLDFTSGIGVVNTGHCHPAIVQAAQEQCAKLIHGQVNLAYHQPMLDLTKELLKAMPFISLDRIFYSTTGAEAVENAVKVARYATGRSTIICFQGGYHGRTHLTMSLTSSSVIYRQRMCSTQNVFVSPFPYELHGLSTEKCIEDLLLLFRQQVLPEEVACMIIEPVLGEGGYVPAPPKFLDQLRTICSEHGILLIIDEVQTGFGRTGKLFATTVEPDILVMAKGLASGFPLSAIATRAELADQQDPGTMGGTYAGNAVACAAAFATQHVIREEGLVENACAMGDILKAGLQRLKTTNSTIRDIRGSGLMVGVEFQPSTTLVGKAVSQSCLDRGMLLLPASVYPTVRFIPPLTATKDEITLGLDIFEDALQDSRVKEAY